MPQTPREWLHAPLDVHLLIRYERGHHPGPPKTIPESDCHVRKGEATLDALPGVTKRSSYPCDAGSLLYLVPSPATVRFCPQPISTVSTVYTGYSRPT